MTWTNHTARLLLDVLEDRASVVRQFCDGVSDICECTVIAGLFWRRAIGLGIPALSQLLDRRDVDGPIVEEGLEPFHISRDEVAIHSDGVAGKR